MTNIAQVSSEQMITFSTKDFSERGSEFKRKFTTALKQGFFYVEIPKECKENLPAAKAFAETIREKEQQLKTFNVGPQLGYQVRQGTQAVAFVAKQEQWKEAYPPEVRSLALKMKDFAIQILTEALKHLSISEKDWDRATGGLTNGKGTHIFSMNNYKPGPEKHGLIPHNDMGWITVLFINKMGLQAEIEGALTNIPPKEGYFVINFGKAFEILINDTSKLKASLHQVAHLSEERISFGAFINHNEGTSIYQIDKNGELQEKQSYEKFLSDRFEEFMALQKQ